MSDAKAASRAIPKAPRAHCPTCGLDAPVRSNGTMGEHRVFRSGPSVLCAGTGRHWDAPAGKAVAPFTTSVMFTV